jgi:hypothetical protein
VGRAGRIPGRHISETHLPEEANRKIPAGRNQKIKAKYKHSMKPTGNATAAPLPQRCNTLLADEFVRVARSRNW